MHDSEGVNVELTDHGAGESAVCLPEGRTLLVTDRGEPIAELRPLPSDTSVNAALLKLSSKRTATLPARTKPATNITGTHHVIGRMDRPSSRRSLRRAQRRRLEGPAGDVSVNTPCQWRPQRTVLFRTLAQRLVHISYAQSPHLICRQLPPS